MEAATYCYVCDKGHVTPYSYQAKAAGRCLVVVDTISNGPSHRPGYVECGADIAVETMDEVLEATYGLGGGPAVLELLRVRVEERANRMAKVAAEIRALKAAEVHDLNTRLLADWVHASGTPASRGRTPR